jgi:hypothetical protein
MCGGGTSMTGLFTMLLGVAAIFAVANFGPILYANREKISVSKKIRNTLQRYVVYAMP